MNATQLAGLFAFGLAVFAALAARPGPWRGLAVIHTLLSVEVLTGLRYDIHLLNERLSPEEYAGRRPLQAAAIVVVLLMTAVILVRARQVPATSAQQRWARLLTTMVVALFCVEAISLHAVDAVMYTKLAGIKIIGWGWLCAGCGVIICSLGSRCRGSRCLGLGRG